MYIYIYVFKLADRKISLVKIHGDAVYDRFYGQYLPEARRRILRFRVSWEGAGASPSSGAKPGIDISCFFQ